MNNEQTHLALSAKNYIVNTSTASRDLEFKVQKSEIQTSKVAVSKIVYVQLSSASSAR